MAINILHATQIAGPDDPEQDVSADEWNSNHPMTMTIPERLVGRASPTPGSAQEVSVGGGLAFNGLTVQIATGGVTSDKLRDSAGLSVIGRTSYFVGPPADIVATANEQVLRVDGTGVLGFSLIPTFTATGRGLVPASGGSSTTFLRGDGVFSLPPPVEFNEIDITGPITTTEDISGRNLFLRPSSDLTPPNNGDFRLEATSDTEITLKFKGSDGIVRTVALTLEEPDPPTIILDFVNDSYTG